MIIYYAHEDIVHIVYSLLSEINLIVSHMFQALFFHEKKQNIKGIAA